MAYIPYGQATVGGVQLAKLMHDLQSVGDRMRDISDWMLQIGGTDLETNADFLAGAGQGSALSDTVAQINADYVTFMGTNRDKIERLARGS